MEVTPTSALANEGLTTEMQQNFAHIWNWVDAHANLPSRARWKRESGCGYSCLGCRPQPGRTLTPELAVSHQVATDVGCNLAHLIRVQCAVGIGAGGRLVVVVAELVRGIWRQMLAHHLHHGRVDLWHILYKVVPQLMV